MRTSVMGVVAAVLVATVMMTRTGAAGQTVKATTPGKGGSPHETVEWKLDGGTVTITYGRPYTKGRKIFGGLHQFDTVWRTGADEATTLVTDVPLMFGSVEVPAGSYTLYTLLGEKQWKLIINTQTGQWGTEYSQDRDLARIDMKTERLPKVVEQHTIAVDKTPAGGVLRIEWDSTRASAPFTIKKR